MSRLVSEKYAGTCSKVAKVPRQHRYAVGFVRQFQPHRECKYTAEHLHMFT